MLTQSYLSTKICTNNINNTKSRSVGKIVVKPMISVMGWRTHNQTIRTTSDCFTRPSGHAEALGKTWGLKPKVVYGIYTAVVKILNYPRCHYMDPTVKLQTSQAELSKLQRIPCLGITGQ
jgi:hypothetical protein